MCALGCNTAIAEKEAQLCKRNTHGQKERVA